MSYQDYQDSQGNLNYHIEDIRIRPEHGTTYIAVRTALRISVSTPRTTPTRSTVAARRITR
jgi:hypothetical protein